jgi:mevalonate kinase
VGSTREMVARVASLRDDHPGTVQAFLTEVTEVVSEAGEALEHADGTRMGQLMNRNHQLLSTVGVSTEAIEQLCQLARDAGAYGAKLTGAGGGGAVIALVALGEHDVVSVKQRAQGVLKGWRKHGFDGFRVALTTGVEATGGGTVS